MGLDSTENRGKKEGISAVERVKITPSDVPYNGLVRRGLSITFTASREQRTPLVLALSAKPGGDSQNPSVSGKTAPRIAVPR